MEWTVMSAQEFERGAVPRRVITGELTIRDAAPLLAVSYRHAKRLVARFRAEGARGLPIGRAGARRTGRPRPRTARRCWP